MKNVLIFGMTDLAEVLIYHLERSLEFNIVALTVEKKYLPSDGAFSRGGQVYPIVPFEEIEKLYSTRMYSFFVCIGYNKMNEGRMEVFRKIKDKGYPILTFIHPTALVQTDKIGEGNLFFENVTIGAYCTVGEGNIFYPCAHIAHHTMVEDYNFFAISSSIAGNVRVDNQCFFGNNCSTKNGIIVADKTLVGAGTYLANNTSIGDVVVPVRSITIDKSSDEIII